LSIESKGTRSWSKLAHISTVASSHSTFDDGSNARRLGSLMAEATGAVAVTGKNIGYEKTMKLVGFMAMEIINNTLYKRKTRKGKVLMSPVATI
jgi:uncharacterized heparinase superfamily protein